MCRRPFGSRGFSKPSWSFGVVCQRCSAKAGRTIIRHNRRSRKKKAPGRLGRFEWLSILYKHDFACAECKERTELTLDHIQPLGKGGRNSFWNVQPLCVTCHREKDDMKPVEESK